MSGTNRVEDGDEMEGQADGKLAQKEATSLGGDREWGTWKAVSLAIKEPLFVSAMEMGNTRESTGRWLVVGAISLAKMSWSESIAAAKGVLLLQQTAWEAPSPWNEF